MQILKLLRHTHTQYAHNNLFNKPITNIMLIFYKKIDYLDYSNVKLTVLLYKAN